MGKSTWAAETLVRTDEAIIGSSMETISIAVDYIVYEVPLISPHGILAPKENWTIILQIRANSHITFGSDGLINVIHDHFNGGSVWHQKNILAQRDRFFMQQNSYQLPLQAVPLVRYSPDLRAPRMVTPRGDGYFPHLAEGGLLSVRSTL